MGARRIRREQRQYDQRVSRQRNGLIKVKERERRERRLVAKLRSGQLPYTPAVMSWLSQALNKPSRQITQQDVDAYLAAKSADS